MGRRVTGRFDRRTFLRGSAGAVGAVYLGGATSCTPPTYSPSPNGTPFTSGVLSGLHSSTEVVLWTRIDPDLAAGPATIHWGISTTPDMSNVIAAGPVAVGPDADWTAKVLVGGLDPDRSYWYRFGTGDHHSPTGRARTLPAPGSSPDRMRLAFGSCQLWTAGWYNAWAGIAAEDVDAVLWLGDYIYESASTVPSFWAVRRDTVGAADTLDTYRGKYKLYRSDPLLQRGHAAHPFVPVWDDHEFVNNCNRFSNLDDPARAAAAYQAWFEYMPVWPIDGTRIHRSHRWGRLADISMLDTRQYRDRQAGYTPPDDYPTVGFGPAVIDAGRPGRSILGDAQRTWLLDGLSGAQDDGVRWKLIGNQVMIAPARLVDLDTPELRALNPNLPLHDGLYVNLDSWDSYFWERDRILAHLADDSIDNVSFLTGDIHSFWQASMRADYDDDTSPIVANEFVGGSVSSPAANAVGSDDLGYFIERQARSWNPAFRYADHRRNGYGIVDATPEKMDVTYRVTRVRDLGHHVGTSVRFGMTAGDPIPTLDRINP